MLSTAIEEGTTLLQRKSSRLVPERNSSIPEHEAEKSHEYDDLPEWYKDNEYIVSGYRPVSASFLRSFKSVGHIHNETVNIYSHVFGASLFFSLPFLVYYKIYPQCQTAGRADLLVFSTFFFGVAICFLLSATFHIVANHSEYVHMVGNQLDYLGIVILMWGSTIPTDYYGFYCEPTLQKVYWMMVSILAVGCIVATLNSHFHHPSWRPYRSAMYTGLGLSAIVPIIHGIAIHGWEVQNQRMSLNWMALMAAFNLSGAAVYAIRIPEKWYPRRHDIYGASHQILHFMVIFAGLAHMVGLLRAFDHLHTHAAPCKSD